MKHELQGLLWFAGGFALAAILSVSYETVRYVPMAVAFGLLCFGCGVLLFLFLSLRRREEALIKNQEASIKAEVQSCDRWSKEFDELRKEESELEKEKGAFEAEKAEWEAEKEVWDALHSDEPNAEESK